MDDLKSLDEVYKTAEKLSTDAAMSQWQSSLKRPDLSEEDRVKGAILAYQRQFFVHMNMTSVNFAEAPTSISELRSGKTGSSSDWTPKDILIAMLRRIDRGEIDLHRLVLCYSHSPDDKENTEVVGFRSSGKGALTNLGLLDFVKYQMITGGV